MITNCFINGKAGSKAQMIKRIMKRKSKPVTIPEMKASFATYISSTGSTLQGIRPTINQHYAKTFNMVDRFNWLLSSIAYKPRCSDQEFCWLINLILLSVVNTWVLWVDWNTSEVNEEDPEELRRFVLLLAEGLLKE